MTTNNHPANGPVSLDRLHQIREILSKAAAQSDGGNIGYAMADAVKVIDGAIASFGTEPVAWMIIDIDTGEKIIRPDRSYFEGPCHPLYAAPKLPQPVVPECFQRLLHHAYGMTMGHDWNKGTMAGHHREKLCKAVEDCRAAMLQAGNHTEQHLDMVDHSGDDNEKSDCKLPFDQWLSQQNEPIDVDCGCVTSEAFFHWLRVAYEAGKSPVIPDGWVACSERMPEKDDFVYIWPRPDFGVELHVAQYGKFDKRDAGWYAQVYEQNFGIEYHPITVTHWMPLPAAPQQEVK